MPAQPRNMPEQEHSIKVRSHELYVDSAPVADKPRTRPFRVYLHDTPAQPLGTLTKVLISLAGILVAVLFVAALWRVVHRHGGRHAAPVPGGRRAATAPAGGESSIVASGQRAAASLS